MPFMRLLVAICFSRRIRRQKVGLQRARMRRNASNISQKGTRTRTRTSDVPHRPDTIRDRARTVARVHQPSSNNLVTVHAHSHAPQKQVETRRLCHMHESIHMQKKK